VLIFTIKFYNFILIQYVCTKHLIRHFLHQKVFTAVFHSVISETYYITRIGILQRTEYGNFLDLLFAF